MRFLNLPFQSTKVNMMLSTRTAGKRPTMARHLRAMSTTSSVDQLASGSSMPFQADEVKVAGSAWQENLTKPDNLIVSAKADSRKFKAFEATLKKTFCVQIPLGTILQKWPQAARLKKGSFCSSLQLLQDTWNRQPALGQSLNGTDKLNTAR